MLVTQSSSFSTIVHSHSSTRPAAAFGTSVTPTQNNIAGATYAEVLSDASLTSDAYAILINVNTIGTSGAARDGLVTIGADSSGGTSYSDVISNLVCGPASGMNNGVTGAWFYFPLWFKSGTAIAAKASVNSATLTAINVHVWMFCNPTNPELVRCGSVVETIGADTANSRGTLVTPGAASEGAWTQIGSSPTRPVWWIETGCGANTAGAAGNVYGLDVAKGDASNKHVMIENAHFTTTTTEVMSKMSHGAFCQISTSDLLYARLQSSNTTTENTSVALYCVS